MWDHFLSVWQLLYSHSWWFVVVSNTHCISKFCAGKLPIVISSSCVFSPNDSSNSPDNPDRLSSYLFLPILVWPRYDNKPKAFIRASNKTTAKRLDRPVMYDSQIWINTPAAAVYLNFNIVPNILRHETFKAHLAAPTWASLHIIESAFFFFLSKLFWAAWMVGLVNVDLFYPLIYYARGKIWTFKLR